jgi:hypothetical protein
MADLVLICDVEVDREVEVVLSVLKAAAAVAAALDSAAEG